jgi:hypothetical protein
MCGVVVGLAPQHSKVNELCDSSPSGPETLDKYKVFGYYRNMEKSKSQFFDFFRKLN